MRHAGEGAADRTRRIIIDCTVNGKRHDIDLPLLKGLDEGDEPKDVDLAYLRSITRDLVSVAERFVPSDGRANVLDIMSVHYKSARPNQRITWHVTYYDGLLIPHSIVTDADTADAAFFNVFWHHACIVSPLRVTSVDDFCAMLDSLSPILAQPLPDFAGEVNRNMRDMMSLIVQLADAGSEAAVRTPRIPRVQPMQDAVGDIVPLKTIPGRRP